MKNEIFKVLDIIGDRLQDMREEGNTDLRSAIYFVDKIYDRIAKSEDITKTIDDIIKEQASEEEL
jgi:hypothetical protein